MLASVRSSSVVLSSVPMRALGATLARSLATLDSKKLVIRPAYKQKPLPAPETLLFGHEFTDHMLEFDWTKKNGFFPPVIRPVENLQIHPAASCLHYGLEGFEGMKAYIDKDGHARLFRPEVNIHRFNTSLNRLGLPELDEGEFFKLLKKLILMEKRWIPKKRGFSLYIRPTFISMQPTLGVGPADLMKYYIILSPVGPYFKSGFTAVSLLASNEYSRAFPGGSGNVKIGGNYAITIRPQIEASKKGFNQILWLAGDNCTEVGTMNFFVFWVNKDGEKELVTAPLDGTILPGVTRKSILEMTREWGEFKVTERKFTMSEVVAAHQEDRLLEVFGAGTACIVTPVKNINYKNKNYKIKLDPNDPKSQAGPLTTRLCNTIMDIQYGELPFKNWSVKLD